MRRWSVLTVVPVVIAAAATSAIAATPAIAASPAEVDTPRNIIVLVGDGMGFDQVDAASLYEHGEARHQVTSTGDGEVVAVDGPASQVYQRFDRQLAASTYNASGGYDPQATWSDFGHVRSRATDSAAAATAMSTGTRTSSGAVGVGPDGIARTHLAERAKQLGKATGVVTSVPLSHGTPAGFVAHNTSRSDLHGIAEEMILTSDLNVIMGAGHPFHDVDGGTRSPDYRYVSRTLFDRVRTGDTRYDLVEDRGDFRSLADGTTPEYVLGIPRVATTLQYHRDGPTHTEPYVVPYNDEVPTLAEMTRAALNTLANASDEGLFAMIEGGAIDWAGHANDLGRLIEEQVAFNQAVEATVDWVEEHSSWDETLVIVVADHETGHLAGAGANPAWRPMHALGTGLAPVVSWHSRGHTNQLVPLYAHGAGAQRFDTYVDGVDPVRGDYVHISAVARLGFQAWGPANVCGPHRGGVSFRDVAGSGHGPSVACLAGLGVVQGFEDGTYRPRAEVTRGQLASFVVRTLELATGEPLPSGGAGLSDVSRTSAHGPAIERLHRAGVVRGYPDGTFRPGEPVSRAQTARYVANALELVLGDDLPRSGIRFPDVSPSSPHVGAIDALVTADVASGYPDGRFGPREPVTRAQMARVLANALEALAAEGAYRGS